MALFSPFGRTLGIFLFTFVVAIVLLLNGVYSMQPATRKSARELEMGKLRKKPCSIFVFVVASLYGVRSKKPFYKRKFILMKVVK